MKHLWVILFLITGCAAIHTTDYLGNEVNLDDEVMSLKEILQDPTDENVMFLTFEIASRVGGRLKVGHNISLRKYIWLVAEENGFIAWQVVNITASSEREENWSIHGLVYEVRFSRSEEDFDKWNERLKR